MNIGVIGTGVMGKNHARVYSKMRGVDEIFVFDINQKQCLEVAAQHGATACTSMDELLRNVDAASICVPTKFHVEVAKQVINGGVHVLIEKPLALDIKSASSLVETAKGSKQVVAVGHIERFNPVVPEVKKHLTADTDYVSFRRHNPGSGRVVDADVIFDLMVHDIDILWNYLFKDQKYAIRGASGVKNEHGNKIVEALAMFGKTMVNVSSSKIASKKMREIIVEDDEKTVVADMMSQEVYIYRTPRKNENISGKYIQENVVEKVSIARVEPLAVELQSFLDAARGKKKFEVTVDEALNSLRICNEISKALK